MKEEKQTYATSAASSSVLHSNLFISQFKESNFLHILDRRRSFYCYI